VESALGDRDPSCRSMPHPCCAALSCRQGPCERCSHYARAEARNQARACRMAMKGEAEKTGHREAKEQPLLNRRRSLARRHRQPRHQPHGAQVRPAGGELEAVRWPGRMVADWVHPPARRGTPARSSRGYCPAAQFRSAVLRPCSPAPRPPLASCSAAPLPSSGHRQEFAGRTPRTTGRQPGNQGRRSQFAQAIAQSQRNQVTAAQGAEGPHEHQRPRWRPPADGPRKKVLSPQLRQGASA